MDGKNNTNFSPGLPNDDNDHESETGDNYSVQPIQARDDDQILRVSDQTAQATNRTEDLQQFAAAGIQLQQPHEQQILISQPRDPPIQATEGNQIPQVIAQRAEATIRKEKRKNPAAAGIQVDAAHGKKRSQSSAHNRRVSSQLRQPHEQQIVINQQAEPPIQGREDQRVLQMTEQKAKATITIETLRQPSAGRQVAVAHGNPLPVLHQNHQIRSQSVGHQLQQLRQPHGQQILINQQPDQYYPPHQTFHLQSAVATTRTYSCTCLLCSYNPTSICRQCGRCKYQCLLSTNGVLCSRRYQAAPPVPRQLTPRPSVHAYNQVQVPVQQSKDLVLQTNNPAHNTIFGSQLQQQQPPHEQQILINVAPQFPGQSQQRLSDNQVQVLVQQSQDLVVYTSNNNPAADNRLTCNFPRPTAPQPSVSNIPQPSQLSLGGLNDFLLHAMEMRALLLYERNRFRAEIQTRRVEIDEYQRRLSLIEVELSEYADFQEYGDAAEQAFRSLNSLFADGQPPKGRRRKN